MECLTDREVLDLLRGTMSDSALDAIDAHLDGCAACRQLVAEAARADSGTPAASAPDADGFSFTRGSSVGRYVVLDVVGHGGMGVVYAAWDPDLDRKVALKILRTPAPGEQARRTRDRSVKEARALARLSHPHVVTIYEAGVLGEIVYLAMEFVDGGTLSSRLRGGPRPWREVLGLFLQAGRGLGAAHAAGLIHRDFKPENVLVGRDGRVRVTDFGLVRHKDEWAAPVPPDLHVEPAPLPAALTASGAIVGTPAYMSPEQHLGKKADARSDQFSFCVALYEALHGARPFAGESADEYAAHVLEGRLSPPPKTAAVPSWVQRALLRGLSVRPEERHPSMEALLDALARDPRAAGRARALRVVVGCLAALGVAMGARELSRREAAACEGAEQHLLGVWDGERKRAVRAAFVATDEPSAEDTFARVETALDAYARRWTAMQTESCEATRVRGEHSEKLLDLRTLCLEDRLTELRALVRLFETADAALVQRAAEAVAGLTHVEGCGNARALLAPLEPPAEARREVQHLRAKLAEAKALRDGGRYVQGLALATEVADKAKAVPYLPLVAEALGLAGELQGRTDKQLAEQTLYEALWAAEAGHHDEAAARAWVKLVFQVGYRLARHEEAYRIGRHARAAIERLGGSDELTAKLDMGLGVVLSTQGRNEEAFSHMLRAQPLIERSAGPDDFDVAVNLGNLGMVSRALGRHEDALRYLGRALEIRRKILGPDHPELASTYEELGAVARAERRADEALAFYTQAKEIAARALGPDHSDVSYYLNGIGEALLLKGRPEEALAAFRRALAIGEKALGNEHRDLAQALTGIGRAELALGHPEAAVQALERAVRLRETQPGDPAETEQSRVELARARKEAGRAHPR